MTAGHLARPAAAATVASVAAYAVALLQQILYARALGVSAQADALAAALAWGVATTGLIGTTLQGAVLPRYAALVDEDPQSARHLLRSASLIGLGLGGILALVTLLLAPVLAAVLLPGADGARREELVALLRITSPLLVGWVLVWLGLTVANARERYVGAGLSPIAASGPVIALLILVAAPSAVAVAVAYVAGVFLQVAVLAFAVPGGLWDALPRPEWSAVRRLVPVLGGLGLSFLLLNVAGLALRALASALEVGSVAAVDYAVRVTIAVEQILLTGLLAVAFTKWSRATPDRLAESLRTVVPVVIEVGLLLAVALALLGTAGVDVLFGARAFNQQAVDMVGLLLAWMAPGVAAQIVLLVLIRAILASHMTRAMIALGSATLGVLLVAGLALLPAGLQGIGVAFSLSWIAAAAVAMIALRRVGPWPLPAADAARAGLVALAATVAGTTVLSLVPDVAIVQLLVGGLVMCASAVVASALVRAPAARLILSMAPW